MEVREEKEFATLIKNRGGARMNCGGA